MDDLLLILTVPAVVIASGVYSYRRCRRHRDRPPSPYTRQAARLAARDAVILAEAAVGSAYATLGGLYDDPPAPHPAARTPTVRGGTHATEDRGPSLPVPARRR
ncbi:hypothetical protein [Streptomyces sp. B1I3]|uniref:hypothetical protein n=1 Tax=Streptomyces sp. B1I3 TaxID=3042264 RepID=UPI00278AD0E2|nr:hypothetical protein [Streptomyces sp. B1I3]MDQ0795773.1 hypothetical protein [Streptomyces sp. B1I3]